MVWRSGLRWSNKEGSEQRGFFVGGSRLALGTGLVTLDRVFWWWAMTDSSQPSATDGCIWAEFGFIGF